MRNHLLLFVAAGTLMLSSCTKPVKKSTAEKPASAVSATETLPENIKIEFSGTDNFTIKNALLKVSLYGMDEKLADAPATLITEKEYEQKSIPFTINLPIPKDAESKINPKPVGPAKYYVTISWDSDGNGKADEKGDIFIDYDKQFPTVKLNNETHKIYLKVLK
ncbi:hypothetical protein [Chryseobacterium sediminis]|uniref:hypothetical protein n=1 Tax=Chryseobacterium sediminis TaxID=1679494 RepID=UPI0028663A93|nr:hypothetical protein [Chryseobacterium sediminis]MDR6462328.1 putative lipoprotein YbaY [Chryseobacterium sediminis]